MLRACKQALRPGGRIAFTTIEPTPGLQPERRRMANRMGPSETKVRSSYENMLRTAGFRDISATDVTAEYGATLRRWRAATEHNEELIRGVIGDDTYEDRKAQRMRDTQAVDDGLLSRFIYTATRPGRR